MVNEATIALATAVILAVAQLLREALDRRRRQSGEKRTRAEDVSDP